ncbi:MAG: flagellar motor switch protein FliN [Treponema sp.]|jgi:flagellar motor switch protein FliN/FliY|nr:flagellar motor switch protein FliN [Treponema sp.]
MSESALSQEELDALMSGGDIGDEPAGGGSEEDRKALENFLTGSTAMLSSNFAQLTIPDASLKGPTASFTNRDTILGELPIVVVVVKADFSSGFPGEHMFVMAEDTAKSVVGLMTHEEDVDLDEHNLSVVSEMVSNLVGTQITALSKQTGNQSLASIAPEATKVPKALVAFPTGDFLNAEYQLDLGDGNIRQLWEVYSLSVTEAVAYALNNDAKAAPSAPPQGASRGAASSGAQASGGGKSAMGAMNVSGSANVQAVQFPSLTPHITAQEQGNISLIMDVFMEMTVELGRTRKLIKEILGMGEGTVIELDKLAGEPVDILVNHKLIAKGEVVVIDENFGVRVTEIVSPQERVRDMTY